jgi:ribonuclease HII
VVVAAVILDPGCEIPGLADSKVLSGRRRERLADQIRERALAFSIVAIDVETIDRINILEATMLGMRRAIEALNPQPDEAWIDGNRVPPDLPCAALAFVKGDALHACISAASILAKTARDESMRALAAAHPGYGFDVHMGYPTAAHRRALAELGPSPIHRLSFAPVRAASFANRR